MLAVLEDLFKDKLFVSVSISKFPSIFKTKPLKLSGVFPSIYKLVVVSVVNGVSGEFVNSCSFCAKSLNKLFI